MDAFVSRKKRRIAGSGGNQAIETLEDDTDTKLALLASLHPEVDASILFEALVSAEGMVDAASSALGVYDNQDYVKRKLSTQRGGVGYQSSLSHFRTPGAKSSQPPSAPLTKKGQTLHLFDPEDVAAHSPCSIIHNFLPADDADRLLRAMLNESKTFEQQTFKIFDNVVKSPHSSCFYVESNEEREKQQTEYLYNGSNLTARLQSH